MNPEKTIAWLRKNKPFLKVSAIGRAAGVPHLLDIINESKNSGGYSTKLTEKHMPELNRIIKEIREK